MVEDTLSPVHQTCHHPKDFEVKTMESRFVPERTRCEESGNKKEKRKRLSSCFFVTSSFHFKAHLFHQHGCVLLSPVVQLKHLSYEDTGISLKNYFFR